MRPWRLRWRRRRWSSRGEAEPSAARWVLYARVRRMSRRDGMMREEALLAIMGRVPVLAPGHVWLAGAGPGDPGHLTLHAVAGLLQADAVVYDALVDQRVLDVAGPAAVRVFAGKRAGKPSVDQADIAETV